MPDLPTLQIVAALLMLGFVAFICILFLLGWILTKRHHEEVVQRLLDEITRLQEARRVEYDRVIVEYSRMVFAKDATIELMQAHTNEWRAIARDALLGLEATGAAAATAVEHVAQKLSGQEK
jgi:hypothetical protein